MRWKKVTLVGVGLLGGSLGLALRRHEMAECVAGFVRRAASIRECQKVGAVDIATLDLARAVEGADLVVLCTPVGQMKAIAGRMAEFLSPGAIVTDVGSVKDLVLREIESCVAKRGAHFIGSHPMAGAETSGVSAARAELYRGAVCVVTPTRRSNRRALRQVEGLWTALGSRVVRLTPRAHDALVSRSSHLPHLLAAALVNYVLAPHRPKHQRLLCATGFRDTTRVASGSPEMWRDIAIANRRNLGAALGGYIKGLRRFEDALKRGDERTLAGFFEMAKRRRDAWALPGASLSPE